MNDKIQSLLRGPTTNETFWQLQYELVKAAAQELLNKIHYSNDLHAIFNIKDCVEYENLQNEINKITQK